MKAWILPNTTGIDSMTFGDFPDPPSQPAPGQVILQVQFAALNPADRYLAIGQYPAKPPFPHILGRDGVGTVLAVGPGVTGIRPGDTRLILRSDVGVARPGTLAQKVAVDASYTTEVPPGWSLEQAAAAPLVYVTAWQALTQWPDLPKDPVLLVTGATGGVGVASIQLAHALGWQTIIALSRSEEKSKTLRTLGATHIFNPENPHWTDHLKSALDAAPPKTKNQEPTTSSPRIDLAIDNIAGPAFNDLLTIMANHGRISCVGRLAGPVPNFNTGSLFFRRLRVGGVAIANYTNEESIAAWHSVLPTLSKTHSKPLIDHIFPFDQVPAAFARLAQGPMGKVLVRIQ